MRRGHKGFWLAALLTIGILVPLAGCGAVGGPGAGVSGTPSVGTSGTLPPPCTGKSLGNSISPAVTVRWNDANHDVSASVGDVVEIQMDVQHVWQLESVTPLDALTPVGSQGVVLNGACVWDFQVARAGDAEVSLVGGALCPIGHACPMYAILAKFTIHGH